MPQMLATALVPWISNALIGLGFSGLAFGATVGAIALGASYLLIAGAAYLVAQAFAPPSPQAPKPEDGKYNLKQTVPPLVYVLGKVKKAGDYALLEEKGGTAHHVIVWAAHHIKGFTQHWLHDEPVTLDGSGNVVTPAHFVFQPKTGPGQPKVRILTRLGLNAETAYSQIVSAFPEIWTNNHRGDGLATVYMAVDSVSAEDVQKVFPNHMPQHSSIGEGHDRLIDPRTNTAGYSENLAIFRYWHLTHPVGGRLTRADMHDPDWQVAANICDQTILNRSGAPEPRYHGGFWFRANNNPVEIGRLMDQAAEMVLYETPDGKVGVHPGAFVEPDTRLTANDIISVNWDANKRRASTVLAVRGRYTDPDKGYNTADAAIYGVPYPTDDERTKTVSNQAVQRHNHMARMQKLAYLRANAPRVRILAHYEPAKNVPYRRFVRVHVPPKMTEAVVEITDRPTLSLRNLTYEFQGIVVPANLYAFTASTEEGVPGANVLPVEREEVPEPIFTASIQREDVGGGSMAAYAEAEFELQSPTFLYELEWQKVSGGEVQSRLGVAGELTVRTLYLADGVQYRLRARTWSSGTPSTWSDDVLLTATADTTPPGVAISVDAVGGAGEVAFSWTAPNSANFVGVRLYLNATNTMTGATLVAVEYGAPNAADDRTVTGIPAGTYYGFVVAINGSGIAAAAQPTGSITVT